MNTGNTYKNHGFSEKFICILLALMAIMLITGCQKAEVPESLWVTDGYIVQGKYYSVSEYGELINSPEEYVIHKMGFSDGIVKIEYDRADACGSAEYFYKMGNNNIEISQDEDHDEDMAYPESRIISMDYSTDKISYTHDDVTEVFVPDTDVAGHVFGNDTCAYIFRRDGELVINISDDDLVFEKNKYSTTNVDGVVMVSIAYTDEALKELKARGIEAADAKYANRELAVGNSVYRMLDMA